MLIQKLKAQSIDSVYFKVRSLCNGQNDSVFNINMLTHMHVNSIILYMHTTKVQSSRFKELLL